MAYGGNYNQKKRMKPKTESLDFLYSDYFHQHIDGTETQTIAVIQNPVNNALKKLEEIENSIAEKVALIDTAENSKKVQVIDEQLNNLLLRLDDIDTLCDENLKTNRSLLIKQVQGTIQMLHTKPGTSGRNSPSSLSSFMIIDVNEEAVNDDDQNINPDNNLPVENIPDIVTAKEAQIPENDNAFITSTSLNENFEFEENLEENEEIIVDNDVAKTDEISSDSENESDHTLDPQYHATETHTDNYIKVQTSSSNSLVDEVDSKLSNVSLFDQKNETSYSEEHMPVETKTEIALCEVMSYNCEEKNCQNEPSELEEQEQASTSTGNDEDLGKEKIFAQQTTKQCYPVQILIKRPSGEYILNKKKLEEIFGQDSLKNLRLSIVSIVGAFRQGKSFLLNFVLHYLQAKRCSNWFEKSQNQRSDFRGFSWSGGMNRDTTGILMWPEVFSIGNDSAVVVVDTQGTFDDETSIKESSFLFTLSTVMSSVQIYNIVDRIQMDHLTNLQYFLGYGQLIHQSLGSKLCEKMIFLIRDWKHSDDYPFGRDGGNRFLNDKWIKSKHSSEAAEVIRTCFEKLECFLMPHPGQKVSLDKNFTGDMNDKEVNPEFCIHLKAFVEIMIEEACCKKIGKSFLMAEEFVGYLSTFTERLQDPNTEPMTLMMALSENMVERCCVNAEKRYYGVMTSLFRNCENITKLHQKALQKTLQQFDHEYPFQGTDIADKTRKNVEKNLLERSIHFFQRIIKDHVSTALNRYKFLMTNFITGTVSLNVTTTSLQNAHKFILKDADGLLKSLLDPHQMKKKLNSSAHTELKNLAENHCAEMKPVYELKVKKDIEQRQKFLKSQMREKLIEVAGNVPKKYRKAMETHCRNSYITSHQLKSKHNQEWKNALHSFEPLVTDYGRNECGAYINRAKTEIVEYYVLIEAEQNRKFKEALIKAHSEALQKYQEEMDALKINEQPISDLHRHHENARSLAIASFKFLKNENDVTTSFLNKLCNDIENKWKMYQKINDKSRKMFKDHEMYVLCSEVIAATHFYQTEMGKFSSTDKTESERFELHKSIKEICIKKYNQKVNNYNPKKVTDAIDELEQKIESLYQDFEEKEARKISLLREAENKRTGKKNYPIGIDLGTTNCCVGVYDEGRVKIMKNNIGKMTTPSTVYFGQNENTFGEHAIEHGFKDPANCIYEMKRIIGRRFNDPVVQHLIPRWSRNGFCVKDQDGDPVIEITNGNQNQFLPEEISGLLLGEMKRLASVYLDSEVFDAVVTIPAYFDEPQREATKRACKLAGINLLRIINEPTAAAIAYGLQRTEQCLSTVLVFDFGGGTCDVSIVEVEPLCYRVKASLGDNQLGGEDFDDNLTDYLAKIYESKNNITLENMNLRRLRRQCERAKRELSYYANFEIYIEFGNGIPDFREKITMKDFDQINKKLYNRVLEPVSKCLKSAGLEVEDIDDVVLVGGSSRLKKIQEIMQQYFPNNNVKIRINPDEAIACGAAIQAAISSGLYTGEIPLIIDIIPISLGVGCIIEGRDNCYDIITARNTELPSIHTSRYLTICNNQTQIRFRVYQGEHTENEFLNSKIGEFTLSDLTKAPAGETAADVTFKIDEDGILDVTAVEVSSSKNNSKSIRITKCVK